MSRSLLVSAAFLSVAHPAYAVNFEDAVAKAVERGVAGLKVKQAANGGFGSHGVGSTALAAVALLECGTPADDPAIQRAAAHVRAGLPDLSQVYHLSLAIILLDRLGEASDARLIHVLAVRLLEGQIGVGAWTYVTPVVTEEEQKKVRALLERRELKTSPAGGPSRDIDPELLDRIANLPKTLAERERQILAPYRWLHNNYDNSNTQFAVLGLWAARRHGIPVDDALRQVDHYFRRTFDNGFWYYHPGLYPKGKMAMTCAGLLGIAAYSGAVRDRQVKTAPSDKGGKPPPVREPLRDPIVIAATAFVANELAQMPAMGLPTDEGLERDYYALWSVERVAMVYSLQTIGPIHWYRVGGTLILQAQQPTGLWKARHEPEVDTCFALLFLKRSNLLPDLSSVLRAKPEPARAESKTTLKAGGDAPPVEGKATLKAGGDAPAAAPAPKADQDPLATLARELQDATPEQRAAAIAKLRDAKGAENTDKLAGVIPKLPVDMQKPVRDALAERLARMTADTLRAKLKDANAELRRAAAIACALKEDAGLTGDLIAALDDKDAWVVRAAGVALRQLTGQDFGPRADATAEERAKAVAAWKEWWRTKRSK